MNKNGKRSCDAQLGADWPTDYQIGPYGTNESEITPYKLPDPLIDSSGTRIENAWDWLNSRRDEILTLFRKFEYGDILPRPDSMRFELLSMKNDALGGTAIRKEVRIHLEMNNGRKFAFDLLLYIPRNISRPVPAFLGLNFKGNHNTTSETDVAPTGFAAPDQLAESNRSLQVDRWCFEETIRRGYASATICYHDIHPDRLSSTGNSIFRLFFDENDYATIWERYSVIGAWAWGLSRGLDYLESDSDIDAARVAVHGHSRLGKTSLWAGATDQRFRMVISNDSGCGGAALHKRKYGENFSQHFEHHFEFNVPCWFVKAAKHFIGMEDTMPFDQHELLTLIAPRPLVVHSATLDFNADPKGEFLACVHASEVYKLFGSAGLPAIEMPKPDFPLNGDISYLYRTGNHDQTPQDWAHYFNLADHYLHGK